MEKIILFLSVFYYTILYSQNIPDTSQTHRIINLSNTSNDEISVIVEFKEEPFFIAQKKSTGLLKTAAQYQNRFHQFKSDISSFHQQAKNQLGKSLSTPIIQREYYRVFFGVSIKIPNTLLSKIYSLPYVKTVHFDEKVTAFLDKSVHRIGADSVWTKFNTQGEGVTVGIIDTGIDYLHPDLGGGFGSTYKVIGGYDFVNNDADPMDDNGHGTHVAGIVAAQGDTVTGVAPKVKLVAYKVLGADGSGTTSNIISAIERTIDPNNDGDISDKLDVVNMSLGSSYITASPDDAKSIAVDNASFLGVTFCISAGNSGYFPPTQGKETNYYYTGWETISSPGNARSAITVGAFDTTTQNTSFGVTNIALFSSRGPSRVNYAIKPEIVAPGVGTKSLKAGGGYLRLSGTSMASPHIAGVAALIKSLHPNYTPEQIKSAIVNSSDDLGENPMRQGSGVVNALKSSSTSTLITPSVLNYGLNGSSQTTWVKAETLTVKNTSANSQTYSTSFYDTPAGISLLSIPQTFTLASGTSQNIIIEISVNNTQISIVNDDIIMRWGNVKIEGTLDTLRLPWAFVRTSVNTFVFDSPTSFFSLTGRNTNDGYFPMFEGKFVGNDKRSRWLSPTTLEIIGLTNDTYDMLAAFSSDTIKIVEKNKLLNNGTADTIHSINAIYQVHFNGVDENGNLLSQSPNNRRSIAITPPYLGRNPFYIGSKPLLLAPTTEPWTLHPVQTQTDIGGTNKIYVTHLTPFTGIINNDITVTNNPAQYVSQHLKFLYPQNTSQAIIVAEHGELWVDPNNPLDNSIVISFYINADTVAIIGNQWEGTLYLSSYRTPQDPNNYFYSFGSLVKISTGYVNLGYKDIESFYMKAENDSIRYEYLPEYVSPHNGTMIFGENPISLNVSSMNNQYGQSSIHFDVDVYGPWREGRYNDKRKGIYTIYNENNEKIIEDSLKVSRYPKEVPAGKYRLEISMNDYFISNIKGKATINNYFDLALQDPHSPSIRSLRIFNSQNKQYSGHLLKNENATLTFASVDTKLLQDSVKVYYRKYNSNNAWVPLNTTFMGNSQFSTDLTSTTSADSTAINLKFVSQDSVGNKTEYVLEPAFAVGNNIPLPIQLFSFTATTQKNSVTLQWQTISEVDTYGFAIERKQLSSLQWEQVGFVEGKGNASIPANYQFNDNIPQGIHYQYRLKIVDKDGSFIYSNIVDVEVVVPRIFSLAQNYPNPFNPLTTITFTIPEDGNVRVKLYDIVGREIKTFLNEERKAGILHQIVIDASSLSTGVYFYQLEHKGKALMKKLMVLK